MPAEPLLDHQLLLPAALVPGNQQWQIAACVQLAEATCLCSAWSTCQANPRKMSVAQKV